MLSSTEEFSRMEILIASSHTRIISAWLTQRQVAAIRYKEGLYLEFSGAAQCDLDTRIISAWLNGVALSISCSDATKSLSNTPILNSNNLRKTKDSYWGKAWNWKNLYCLSYCFWTRFATLFGSDGQSSNKIGSQKKLSILQIKVSDPQLWY